MKVGEAIERSKQASELTPLLKRRQELAKQLLRYQVLWRALRAKVSQMTAPDEATLFRAGGKRVEVKRELMELEDAETLERLATERDLAFAHDELTYLGLRYAVQMPGDQELVYGSAPPAGLTPSVAQS